MLREDLLDEIEETLDGVKRGSRTVEKGLRELRTTWEGEVNDLIEEVTGEAELADTPTPCAFPSVHC